MNDDSSIPFPIALCPWWGRYMGQLHEIEERLANTRGDIDFRRTAHCQIVTAEHLHAEAWRINGEKENWTLVYEAWIYPEERERVERDIFEPLRESSQKHACHFTQHKLHFRWSCDETVRTRSRKCVHADPTMHNKARIYRTTPRN